MNLNNATKKDLSDPKTIDSLRSRVRGLILSWLPNIKGIYFYLNA